MTQQETSEFVAELRQAFSAVQAWPLVTPAWKVVPSFLAC